MSGFLAPRPILFALSDRAKHFGYSQFDVVGMVEIFVHADDPRPVAEQLADRMKFSGGWQPIDVAKDALGPVLAVAKLANGEVIEAYDERFIAVIEQDGSYAVARPDPAL
jgi:hypothetical protein